MSDHHFHVHGLHDHELEHAAHGSKDGHTGHAGHAGQLAVITAVLATVGAIFAYMGGATQANAGLYKNDAAIKKTEASNQWAFYQAKSGKHNLAELAIDLGPADKKAYYAEQIQRYQSEKTDIKAKAEQLEKESKSFEDQSEQQMHQHHRWAQATTVLQVAIAMAAIALLTKKKWSEYLVFGLGSVGLALGAAAWFHL